MNHTRASHRDHSLNYLDAARSAVDLIASFHEQRRAADASPERQRELTACIGETHQHLGFALKAAEVQALLAIAQRLDDLAVTR